MTTTRFLPSIAVCTLALAASAQATQPHPVKPADLDGIVAERPVNDKPVAPRALRRLERRQLFADAQGRRIQIASEVEGLALAPYAAVLAALRHGDEIEDVVVIVVTSERLTDICGDGAAACYGADDPGGTSNSGQMWIDASDPDWAHSVVHEYGHHIDTQLLNVARLDATCPDRTYDGSRNWYFRRELDDDLSGHGFSCQNSPWEQTVGELYAEDFVALNGIKVWRDDIGQHVGPPSAAILRGLESDLVAPFAPRHAGRVVAVRRGSQVIHSFTVKHWTLSAITFKSRSEPRADLYLRRTRAGRPAARLARSDFPAPRGRVEHVLEPGSYEVVVHRVARNGRGLLRVALD